MIYLRLAGGLGNQLYQIAAATLLSLQRDVGIRVFIDSLSQYSSKRKPDYLNIIAESDKFKIIKKNQGFQISSAFHIIRGGRWFPFIGTNDKNFESRLESKYIFKTQLMDGYFQTHWNSVRFNSVLALLKIRDVPICFNSSSHEVVVHIRGGDFRLSRLHLISEDYYSRSVILASRAGWKQFKIVSDDSEYAAAILNRLRKKFTKLAFVGTSANRSPIEDFNLIRSARARIIGNSTFAWWATALSQNMGPTWSPKIFLPDTERKLILPCEIIVDN